MYTNIIKVDADYKTFTSFKEFLIKEMLYKGMFQLLAITKSFIKKCVIFFIIFIYEFLFFVYFVNNFNFV